MAYLLGAVVLSAVLAWSVVWWHRRPKSMERAIDDFWQARQAIAPRPPGERLGPYGPEGDHGHAGEAGEAGGRR